jgi:ParB family transcriptional regulator, chromosome partitioning protein
MEKQDKGAVTNTESEPDDDDDLFGPIPSFEEAVEKRKKRISELLESEDKAQRRLADRLKECRRGNRCNLDECPVCERRKLVAQAGVPAELIERIGSLDPAITISVKAIHVVGKRRPLNEQKVRAFCASIKEIGLQMPITAHRVKNKLVLDVGAHRLEAVKRLGWKSIPCVVVPNDKNVNRIWQLSENFYRADLSALERAETVDELRTLVQEKRRGAQVAPPGGRQPKDLGTNQTAKDLGITRDEVRRARTIAAIAPKVKVRVRELGLDDNQQALVHVGKQTTPDGQARAVEEILERKRAEGASYAAEPAGDQKEAEEINTLQAQIRQQQAKLAANRKRLQLIADQRAVRGEAPADTAPAEQATSAPLSPDDEAKVAALIKAFDKYPKLKAKLAKASPAVLDRVITIIRSQQAQQ